VTEFANSVAGDTATTHVNEDALEVLRTRVRFPASPPLYRQPLERTRYCTRWKLPDLGPWSGQDGSEPRRRFHQAVTGRRDGYPAHAGGGRCRFGPRRPVV